MTFFSVGQGSIYGRRDHCQSEYDHKHSEPEICNFYVQKIKIISFMYITAFLLWLLSFITVFLLFGVSQKNA